MGNFIRSVLSAASARLQQKTITPTTSQQTVGPDSGYDGLSQVTVDPIPSEYVIPTAITPSNSSPVSMASGSAYKPSANGYAISSYSSSSKSPSSSGTYFSSGWNYMNSSGYAYSPNPPSCKTGSFSWSSSAQTTVNVGFKPKYLCIRGQSTSPTMIIYNEDAASGTTQFLHANGNNTVTTRNLGTSTGQYLYSINSNGFTVNKTGSGVTGYYFAIG